MLEKKPKLPTYINYPYIPPLFEEKEISHDETFLITLNNLIYSDYQIQKIKNYNVLFLDLRSEALLAISRINMIKRQLENILIS